MGESGTIFGRMIETKNSCNTDFTLDLWVPGPDPTIPLTEVLHQIGLINHACALLGVLHDGLCAHTTALGGEVDACENHNTISRPENSCQMV